jgi:hypothetical protein
MEKEIDFDYIMDEIDAKEIVVEKPKEVPVVSTTDITNKLINMTENDRDTADEVFNMFFSKIAAGTDYSQGSKEQMVRALELKISASKNLIELLKIMKGGDGKTGIFINTDKEIGIDLNKLKNEL